jgi:hypothetical protein
MSTASPFSEALHRALLQPTGGVVGLVDCLLGLCQEYDLQIEWQVDHFRECSCGGHWQELNNIRIRKSVFRGVLARLATFGNQRGPNGISPYGGVAEITVGTNPATVFRVAFANASSEQRLELCRVQSRSDNAIDSVLSSKGSALDAEAHTEFKSSTAGG